MLEIMTIDLFPDATAIFVFPQCIVGWPGAKNFAAC